MQGKGSAGSGTYRFKMKEGRDTMPVFFNQCPSTQCLSSLRPIPTHIFDHYISPSNSWTILRILPPKWSSRIKSLWYTPQERYPGAWCIPSCTCTTGYDTSNSASVNRAKDICHGDENRVYGAHMNHYCPWKQWRYQCYRGQIWVSCWFKCS
jgi:hypothetical protein